MASFTIKGIPDPLLEQLRRSAEQHRRSLNSELLFRLERSVASTPMDADALLTRVRALRERARLPHLTDAMLQEAIDEGRP